MFHTNETLKNLKEKLFIAVAVKLRPSVVICAARDIVKMLVGNGYCINILSVFDINHVYLHSYNAIYVTNVIISD